MTSLTNWNGFIDKYTKRSRCEHHDVNDGLSRLFITAFIVRSALQLGLTSANGFTEAGLRLRADCSAPDFSIPSRKSVMRLPSSNSLLGDRMSLLRRLHSIGSLILMAAHRERERLQLHRRNTTIWFIGGICQEAKHASKHASNRWNPPNPLTEAESSTWSLDPGLLFVVSPCTHISLIFSQVGFLHPLGIHCSVTCIFHWIIPASTNLIIFTFRNRDEKPEGFIWCFPQPHLSAQVPSGLGLQAKLVSQHTAPFAHSILPSSLSTEM